MASPSPTPQCFRQSHRRYVRKAGLGNGFTLPELLIAASLGIGIAMLTGEALVTHARSSARAESLQRQRDDWYRATSFIESEIAMSERIYTVNNNEDIDPACPISAGEVRLALDINRSLPPILYGVKERSSLPASQRDQWLGDRVLIRCGPGIGSGAGGASGGSNYDDYLPGTPVASVLIDALDGMPCNAKGHLGFCVNTPTAKSASFTLALQGVKTTSSAYRFGSGSHSRINPITTYPDPVNTICNQVCDTATGICEDSYVYQGRLQQSDVITAGSNGSDVIICGLGGSSTNGDQLTSFDGQDVIDAEVPSKFHSLLGPGTRIDGGNGRNFLYGTQGNDIIKGGADDDTLVGRCGSDQMEGGDGNNNYLPWLKTNCGGGTTQITGGDGTDIVFLHGQEGDYSPVTCSGNTCSISKEGRRLTMTKVDVLIFGDSRKNL